jgi:dolichyl-diphosphooligosaccharide--protein glycosyltransferase
MTLPYATTGYDEYGPENGYTNVSVRATGPYTIQSAGQLEGSTIVNSAANVSVEEGRVNGDISGPKTVTLERQSQNFTISGGDGGSASDGSDDRSGTSDSTSTSDVTAPATPFAARAA